METTVNKMKVRFIASQEVGIKLLEEGKEYHYGSLPPYINTLTGIVVASDYSRQAGEMSYLVQLESTGKSQFWFLESELY